MNKPKEQIQPSYIDIVNWFWEHAIYFEDYKSEYAVLFFAIIDSVNKNYWKETELEYDRIINKTKLSKRAYLDARRWLMSNQIINFVAGKNEFAKAKFSLGIAVQNCTSTAPLLHLQCSSDAPLLHLQRSSTAPSIKDNKDFTDKKDLKDFIAPTFDEFHSFCKENGFEHIAKKAFDYYSGNGWKDNQNKKVKNWKLKLQSVWFDETRNPKPAPVPTAPPQPVDDRDIYQYFQYTHGNNELYYKVLRVNAEDYFQREMRNTGNKCIPKDNISPERRAKATLIRT